MLCGFGANVVNNLHDWDHDVFQTHHFGTYCLLMDGAVAIKNLLNMTNQAQKFKCYENLKINTILLISQMLGMILALKDIQQSLSTFRIYTASASSTPITK